MLSSTRTMTMSELCRLQSWRETLNLYLGVICLPLLLVEEDGEAEKVVSTGINFGNSPACLLPAAAVPCSVIPNTLLILLPNDCLLFGSSIELGVVGVDDVDEGDILLDLDVLIGVTAVLLVGSERCFTLEFEVEGDS